MKEPKQLWETEHQDTPRVGGRTVLYTNDFEPITILELSQTACTYLEQRGIVRLPVYEKPSMWLQHEPHHYRCMTVEIRAEVLRRKNRTTLMLFTTDVEHAMLLKAAFLPGQWGVLNDERDNAFAKGFMEAMMSIGGM